MDPAHLQTLEPETLTIATDEPAYEPWMVDNDPTNKEGFESAVAYAVAEQLGYSDDQVTWTRTPFNVAIQPGDKTIRLRHQPVLDLGGAPAGGRLLLAVHTVAQAVVALEGNPAAEATSVADLQGLRLGAQVATTSAVRSLLRYAFSARCTSTSSVACP